MIVSNINPYDQSVFETEFRNTKLFEILAKDFDTITFSKLWIKPDIATPREEYGIRKSIFTAVPFYYLGFLTKCNPTKIYDLGCGWNIFKKYIPTIIGVGAEDPSKGQFHGDIQDFVDDTYINGHQEYFESVYSINALHFIPLGDLRKRVIDFYSMIKPNGIGWLALNIQRMIDQDFDRFGNKDRIYLDNFVRQQLSYTGINYLVFDVDLTVMDEYMDGNIRLVMQK